MGTERVVLLWTPALFCLSLATPPLRTDQFVLAMVNRSTSVLTSTQHTDPPRPALAIGGKRPDRSIPLQVAIPPLLSSPYFAASYPLEFIREAHATGVEVQAFRHACGGRFVAPPTDVSWTPTGLGSFFNRRCACSIWHGMAPATPVFLSKFFWSNGPTHASMRCQSSRRGDEPMHWPAHVVRPASIGLSETHDEANSSRETMKRTEVRCARIGETQLSNEADSVFRILQDDGNTRRPPPIVELRPDARLEPIAARLNGDAAIALRNRLVPIRYRAGILPRAHMEARPDPGSGAEIERVSRSRSRTL